MDLVDLGENGSAEETGVPLTWGAGHHVQSDPRETSPTEGLQADGTSPWAPGASQSDAILTEPIRETSRGLVEADTRALSLSNGLEAYTGPLPEADAFSLYNAGADWPSSSTSQPQVRRRSLTSEDDESGSEGEGQVGKSREVDVAVSPIRTGLVYSSVMMLHADPLELDEDDYRKHPEQPERTSRIFSTLKSHGCVARMKRIPIREVQMAEVLLVHDKGIWDGVQRSAFFSHESLMAQSHLLEGSSLYINEHSARCARLSCGGVIEMCDAVASGRIKNGFAIVRPPGHHAEPDRPMGFCLYNNVAVAARYLQEKYAHAEDTTRCKRIAILDWDVHHGNGTQAAFYDDENVLYISIHRYEDASFFPASRDGDHDRVGGGAGAGRNVNIPWPGCHMADGDYMAAFSRIVMPIVTEFAPDLVIVSAGFDAADGDPLGECHVSPLGYAHMTYDLASIAHGRLVVALEGGYNLDAIARSALSVTEVLLGESPDMFAPGLTCSSKAEDTFRLVERSHSPYWQSIRRPHLVAEPDEDEGLAVVELSDLIARYRAATIAEKFHLTVLPLRTASQLQPGPTTGGEALCSADLLSHPKDVLVLFVHDMGNLRTDELPGVDFYPQQDVFHLVDGSSQIVQWAHDKDISLVDLCLHFQLPTSLKAPLPLRTRRQQTRLVQPKALSLANESLVYLWDNFIAMARTQRRNKHPNRPMNIVFMGLGTACASLMHLIEQRGPTMQEDVRAIVQLPGHGTIPTIPKGDGELRKWYYKKSLVLLPYNHALYTFDQQAQSGKRLGHTVRSSEVRAIQVLRTQFPTICSFVEKLVPRLQTNPAPSTDASPSSGAMAIVVD